MRIYYQQGTLCALPMSFLFPPICYIAIKEGPMLSREKLWAWLILGVGSVLFVLGLVMIVIDYNTGDLNACLQGSEPEYCLQAGNTSIL